MKFLRFVPLLFLTACSTAPKLVLRPQPSAVASDNTAVRYPEIVRAYHFGRYVDPNDDQVMHEQHTVFRVEENARWNLHPGSDDGGTFFSVVSIPHNAAFIPLPVNDAILAEVNFQRIATAQIGQEARTFTMAQAQFQGALQQARTNLQQTVWLQSTVHEIKQRLDALESAQRQPSSIAATNEPADSSGP